MVKKVWGTIFVLLGVIFFLFGIYKYNQVENFVNLANYMHIGLRSNNIPNIFQQSINAAYQESYIFIGLGVILAFIGTFMLKKSQQ